MTKFAIHELAFLVVASLASACGPASKAPAPPQPPPSVSTSSTPTLTINASYPDKPPEAFVSLWVLSSAMGTTTLSIERLDLLTESGSSPVATLHGRLEPSSFDFASSSSELARFAEPTELNRDLAAACSATKMELRLRGSACACSIVVKSPIRVRCMLDARAEDVLGDPGLAAPAGKPCAMRQMESIRGPETLDEEHRYRYGSGGRLRFLDVYDAQSTFIERQAFTYEASWFLHQVDTIKIATRLIDSRKTYFYDGAGLLARVEYDGDRGIDGVPDWTSTYALGGSTWLKTLVYADPTLGTRSSTYVYNARNRTISHDGATAEFAAPLDSPNQFFALPEEVEGPKILGASGAVYTYDTDGRLQSIGGGIFLRQDFLYSCP